MSFHRGSSRRVGWISSVAAAGLAVLATFTSTPANAAVTQIWAGVDASVTTDHRTSPATSTVNFYYDAFVTVDNAQFRIDHGAQVRFDCYGVSNGARKDLFTTLHSKYSSRALQAYGDGILVKGLFSRPKGTLFDVNKSGKESLFCDASYTDPFTSFSVFTTSGWVTGSY
ncbi:hypothetical protein [Kribbella ginsengisoli]|uniref:Tat pathway signal sequence domain protein n=1 Tax=Kribbella ginsengisoli TaxID=363865 RepID=A0ABP6Z7N0_9ACTN